MSSFAQGKFALAISDRSGMAFPYNEMVREWNGAFVHMSEYEPKQPQLDPKPTNADPQALIRARPARTEFATEDFLPNNPFSVPNASKILTVNAPNSKLQNGDIIRFRNLKTPVDNATLVNTIPIEEVELSTTLTADITETATSITVADTQWFPNSGYFIIEKVNSETGMFQNETIEFSSVNRGTNTFTIQKRGTSATFRGSNPQNTTAGSHLSGAKVFGGWKATMVQTTFVNDANTTVTEENSFTISLDGGGVVNGDVSGGGLQCTYGPINDRG